MILSNLSEILSERKMTITELADKTGISRISLAALANNKSLGINYETLDAICINLNITPKEFFTYIPCSITKLSSKIETNFLIFDISFIDSEENFYDFTLSFYKTHNGEYYPTKTKSNIEFADFLENFESKALLDFLEKVLISNANSKTSSKTTSLNLSLFFVIEQL